MTITRKGNITTRIIKDQDAPEVIAHLSPPIPKNLARPMGVKAGTRIPSNSAAKRYMRSLGVPK